MGTILFLSTVFCSFLPLTTIFTLTPYISKKGTCFGVMLMEDAQQSSKIRKIKRDYSVAACISGIALAGVCAVLSSYSILAIALVGYCAACLALFLASATAVKNLVMTENWENFQKELNMHYIPVGNKKGAVSAWWYALYLPVIAPIWYITYGADIKYMFVLPAIQVIFGGVMLFVHFLIKNSSQYACKNRVKKSIEENIKFRRSWSLFAILAGFAMEIMLGILQLGLLEIIKNIYIVTAAPFIVTISVTAAAVMIAIRSNNRL